MKPSTAVTDRQRHRSILETSRSDAGSRTYRSAGRIPSGDLKEADWFEGYGNDLLCCWRIGRRIWRFQTRDPHFARKLSQRAKSRNVLVSVQGEYLQAFDETLSRSQARRLVNRYLLPTNRAPTVKRPQVAPKKTVGHSRPSLGNSQRQLKASSKGA